jgi:hypothetical protein
MQMTVDRSLSERVARIVPGISIIYTRVTLICRHLRVVPMANIEVYMHLLVVHTARGMAP